MSDDREQTKGSMDAYRVAEERFLCDINNLIDEYGESTYENLDSTLDEAEQMLSAWKPMFEHFLYECLYYYEQTEGYCWLFSMIWDIYSLLWLKEQHC